MCNGPYTVVPKTICLSLFPLYSDSTLALMCQSSHFCATYPCAAVLLVQVKVQEEEEEEEERRYFGRLATFCFIAFMVLFCATRRLVGHENTQR